MFCTVAGSPVNSGGRFGAAAARFPPPCWLSPLPDVLPTQTGGFDKMQAFIQRGQAIGLIHHRMHAIRVMTIDMRGETSCRDDSQSDDPDIQAAFCAAFFRGRWGRGKLGFGVGHGNSECKKASRAWADGAGGMAMRRHGNCCSTSATGRGKTLSPSSPHRAAVRPFFRMTSISRRAWRGEKTGTISNPPAANC